MTEGVTERQEEIFYEALSIEPGGRDAYLDRTCAGDAGLRAAVGALLSKQPDAERFFQEGSPGMNLAPLVEESVLNAGGNAAANEEIGKRIGPYKLLQKIGEGGCGAVYMAQQEKPLHRRVALKVIKLGMDTRNVIARFEGERQALALMDHPGIANVLDAGATEAGRPFFVMELVRGERITDYCDQNNLDVPQRLDLFIRVCQAIQHAHQKGVIHRDIKPSNILVTMHDGVPVPKVIDFGIAKATDGRLTDGTAFTAFDQFIGTPAYMSPEQAEMSGLDVDTRSDIYSLGVLLYELLTGKTPFEPKELMASGLDAMRHTLREKEPMFPSTLVGALDQKDSSTTAGHRHTESRKLVSVLRGDLDWIVMKALEKDRRRRYETAEALALDVRRYLDHEPVAARPPSRLYRMGKLMRRNRVIFAAIGAVSLALILGFGTSTWLFFREREARVRATAAEREEFRLRQAAETREQIAQAAFAIGRRDVEEADKLVGTVTGMQPSLEAENVLRTLGEWNVLHGKMPRAAALFLALLQADQSDRSVMISQDLLMAGPVLVEKGDIAGYDHFRREAMARFSGTKDPIDAERTVKISLLTPADPETMAQLAPFADVAIKSFNRDKKKAGTTLLMASWRCMSLSLMAYRKGDYPAALDWGRRTLAYAPETPSLIRDVTVRIICAMAKYKLGATEHVRGELDQARSEIATRFSPGFQNRHADEGPWFDWYFARILLREAEALMVSGPQKPAGHGLFNISHLLFE